MKQEQKPEVHCMVDLETLSTAYNARILAIGAVKFNVEQGVYSSFYQAIAPPKIEHITNGTDSDGFHISSDTMSWWATQSPEARAVFTDPNAMTIWSALLSFRTWVLKDNAVEDVRVWGNGASFDNVILSTAYDIGGMEKPWKFYNDRCYRTIKNVAVNKVEMIRTGTYHNALDDAESQANHLLAMNVRLA